MDMDSSMSGGPGLTDVGLNMSNYTVASDFLAALLDDTTLQQFDYAIARAFWYGVVIVIVLAGMVNWSQWGLLKLRLRAAAANSPRPASPSNSVTSFLAGCTAVVREVSYHQITPLNPWLRIPAVGSILVILVYLGYIMGLQFFDWDYPGAQYWEAQGLRAGWLTIAQFPLLLLLAGKRNLIGYAVGVSYERLQILHRWVARIMLLTATIHGGVQAYGWKKYDVMQIEISTDSCIPTGFSTWILLLWLVFSATAPIRNWRYEIFVVQHIITFIGFVVAVFYHLPSTALSSRIYAWIGVGVFIFDRLVRTLIYAFNNTKPANSTLHALSGDVTKVRITSPRIKNWSPGQHVFLSIPELGFAQSHPATILSIPSSHDNDLVFILRAHRGFTQRLLRSAQSSSTDLSQGVQEKQSARNDAAQSMKKKHLSLIGGPYGGSHSDFAAFDTVLLIAGSTGVSFTLPILLDIAHRSANQRLPVRRIVFVWVMRTISCTEWIADELQRATESLLNVGIEIEVRLFVTCEIDSTNESTKKAGCQCRNVEGPCCCSDLGIERRQAASSASITQASNDQDIIRSPSSETPKQMQLGMGNSIPFSCSTIESGRPQLKPLLWDLLDHAKGETGVAVCGPLGLVRSVRNTVATVSEQRGSNKGTGAEGVYLHAESFAW
ncbi:Ferric/cupric reductase transmembrane component 7 [Penicillium rolfsii]|nr:Ferric/cupric reductase transmembrane component 7 [Penicillium rolfsii]